MSRPQPLTIAASVLVAISVGVVGVIGFGRTSSGPDAFCSQLPVVRDVSSHLAAYDTTGLREDLTELTVLRADAPAEIEPQVTVLIDVVRSFTEALEAGEAGESPVETQRRAEKVWRDRRTDFDRIAAAARDVTEYARATCGIDLAGSSG